MRRTMALMGEPPVVQVGDLIQMRKPHACGANQWTVVRTGVDIRVRCRQCGRTVLMPRTDFLRAARRISHPEPSPGAPDEA